MEPGGKHVMDRYGLRAKFGTNVKIGQIVALNRLSAFVNNGPGADKNLWEISRHRNTSLALAKPLREIHEENICITAIARNPMPTNVAYAAPTHPDQTLITNYLKSRTLTAAEPAIMSPESPWTAPTQMNWLDRRSIQPPHHKERGRRSKTGARNQPSTETRGDSAAHQPPI